MKYTAIIFFLSSAFWGSCQSKPQTADFKKMEWLIGNWKGESNGMPFYETWVQISDTEFNNVNYSICNGDTIRDGQSKIEIRDGKIVYSSNNLLWYLTELTDSSVIF